MRGWSPSQQSYRPAGGVPLSPTLQQRLKWWCLGRGEESGAPRPLEAGLWALGACSATSAVRSERQGAEQVASNPAPLVVYSSHGPASGHQSGKRFPRQQWPGSRSGDLGEDSCGPGSSSPGGYSTWLLGQRSARPSRTVARASSSWSQMRAASRGWWRLPDVGPPGDVASGTRPRCWPFIWWLKGQGGLC